MKWLILAGVLAGAGASGVFGRAAQEPETATLRIRGQVTVEQGGPVDRAQIKTDALRGPGAAQFTAHRVFTTRTGRNGEWSLLGVTRGLWILEVSASEHLPHVVVVPIAMMLKPEPAAWDTSLALLPVSAILRADDRPARLILDAADRALAGDKGAARTALMQLAESRLDAEALCAAGDVALLIREPAVARRFFALAASARPAWYRPHLGIASASMMNFDIDEAMKAYGAARTATENKRLQRMLSGAIRDLQQIRIIGGGRP